MPFCLPKDNGIVVVVCGAFCAVPASSTTSRWAAPCPGNTKPFEESSAQSIGSRVLANLLLADKQDEANFARFQRRAATPEVAAGFLGQIYSADVSGLLATVRQPALILHYRDDPAVPVAGGYELAHGLPHAELILLEGAYHLPPAGDVDPSPRRPSPSARQADASVPTAARQVTVPRSPS
jgi:pimeloyl-ACP methyl ester carboxylesterase